MTLICERAAEVLSCLGYDVIEKLANLRHNESQSNSKQFWSRWVFRGQAGFSQAVKAQFAQLELHQSRCQGRHVVCWGHILGPPQVETDRQVTNKLSSCAVTTHPYGHDVS